MNRTIILAGIILFAFAIWLGIVTENPLFSFVAGIPAGAVIAAGAMT